MSKHTGILSFKSSPPVRFKTLEKLTVTTRTILSLTVVTTATAMNASAADASVKLMTLDPGHFHAALVQKSMYPQVDPVVHVYAPGGADLDLHLKRVEAYNTRAENPTHWQERVYTGADFLDRMVQEKPGNVVVISGNNARKGDYILRSVQAGLNVLADKPMAINPADFEKVRQAFKEAEKRGVLLYDIMTERHETTTILQRELSKMPAVFGELEKGTPATPAITKESVHHYFKYVSGNPLQRPPWFFDVKQQGEGIMDISTHLVDLVQWEAFPDIALQPSDVTVISARRWTTKISREQFKKATGLDEFPDYLKPQVNAAGELEVYCNGEFIYKLRGVTAKVSVIWNFQSPEGAEDTHFSIMRGTRANLVIRQGKEQNYKPTLYVEKKTDASDAEFEKTLLASLSKLQGIYPGVTAKKIAGAWEIIVPDKFKIGHEAHFAQVMDDYLKYLAAGKLPDWEVPNMITKYYTLMEAYRLSR